MATTLGGYAAIVWGLCGETRKGTVTRSQRKCGAQWSPAEIARFVLYFAGDHLSRLCRLAAMYQCLRNKRSLQKLSVSYFPIDFLCKFDFT